MKKFEELTEQELTNILLTPIRDLDKSMTTIEWFDYLKYLEQEAWKKYPHWNTFDPDRPWNGYRYGVIIDGVAYTLGFPWPEEYQLKYWLDYEPNPAYWEID